MNAVELIPIEHSSVICIDEPRPLTSVPLQFRDLLHARLKRGASLAVAKDLGILVRRPETICDASKRRESRAVSAEAVIRQECLRAEITAMQNTPAFVRRCNRAWVAAEFSAFRQPGQHPGYVLQIKVDHGLLMVEDQFYYAELRLRLGMAGGGRHIQQ